MAGHTPRPWNVDPKYPGDVLDSKGNDVATMFTPKGTGTKPHDECYANARLIAAAPDLLEAVKAFMPLNEGLVLQVFPREGGKTSLANALRLASEAIAKAEA